MLTIIVAISVLIFVFLINTIVNIMMNRETKYPVDEIPMRDIYPEEEDHETKRYERGFSVDSLPYPDSDKFIL